MTTTTAESTATNSDLENGQVKGAPDRQRQEAALAKRRRLRKLDLLSMNGLLRANAKIIRDVLSGAMPPHIGDTVSRSIRRQSEIMHAINEEQARVDLIARLEALERRPAIAQDLEMFLAPPAATDEGGEGQS